MKCLAVLFMCLLFNGCGAPNWPAPGEGTGQLLVHFKAKPRQGTEGKVNKKYDYYEAKPGFTTVNYKSLEGITACLLGKGLEAGGSLSDELIYEVGHSTQGRVLLLPVGGTLIIRNRSKNEIDIFSSGKFEGFDVTIAGRQETRVTLKTSGEFEINDTLGTAPIKLLVLDHRWGLAGRAGDSQLMDGIPPGSYRLRIDAPRLPVQNHEVTVRAGERVEIKVTVGVGELSRP